MTKSFVRTGAWLRAMLGIILLALGALAYAVAYCPRPNGVATRQMVFADMQGLRPWIESRIARGKSYLLIVNVPPELQQTSEFRTLEDAATVEYIMENAELRQRFAVLSGTPENSPLFRRSVAKQVESQHPQSQKTAEDIGLVYLYSNRRPILDRFSADVARDDGLVVEGRAQAIQALLEGKAPEEYGWWERNLPKDVDTIITIGFDANPKVRGLINRKSRWLRISDYEVAKTGGVPAMIGVSDVEPKHAAVLNLFPTSADEIAPWRMSPQFARLYVENGRIIQSELTKIGYGVERIKEHDGPAEVAAWVKRKVAEGKKVLIIGDTNESDPERPFVRMPWSTTGLGAKEMQAFDDAVLQNLFIVACESQSLHAKLPLSVVGTIYSDRATDLIRATFAAPQADTMGDYLQASSRNWSTWVSTVARAAESLLSSRTAPPLSTVTDSSSTFVSTMTVSQVLRVAAPAAATTAAAASASPVNTSPSSEWSGTTNSAPPTAVATPNSATSNVTDQDPLRDVKLFGAGLLGAASREGIRWQRLAANRRTKAYLRPLYLCISFCLLLAAGGVALIFGQAFSSVSVALVVAFVAGVGFEKVVKMAADLKIWTPSVPLGTAATSSGATAEIEFEDKGDVLSFLRHDQAGVPSSAASAAS